MDILSDRLIERRLADLEPCVLEPLDPSIPLLDSRADRCSRLGETTLGQPAIVEGAAKRLTGAVEIDEVR